MGLQVVHLSLEALGIVLALEGTIGDDEADLLKGIFGGFELGVDDFDVDLGDEDLQLGVDVDVAVVVGLLEEGGELLAGRLHLALVDRSVDQFVAEADVELVSLLGDEALQLLQLAQVLLVLTVELLLPALLRQI